VGKEAGKRGDLGTALEVNPPPLGAGCGKRSPPGAVADSLSVW